MLKRLIISIKNLMLLSSGNESIIAYASCRRVMYFASDVLEAGPKAVDFYFHEVLPLGLPAMQKFVEILKEKGEEHVVFFDLARDDMAEAIACAYRYDRLVLAGATYDASLFPCMEDFLYHLKIKNFQNRRVALVENGTWAPMAGKLMKAYLEGMKKIELVGDVVTIKSSMSGKNLEELDALADALLA